jgi:uncharacterized protein (TIRG00374 family)
LILASHKKKIILKKFLFNILVIGLIIFIANKFNLFDFSHLSYDKLSLKSFLISVVVILLSSLRFFFVAKKFNLELSYPQAISVTSLSGLFFYILPGSIGSEISRFFLLRKTHTSKSSILATILVDRGFALLSQILIVIIIFASILNSNKIFYLLYLISIIFVVLMVFLFINLKIYNLIFNKLKKFKVYNILDKFKFYFLNNTLHLSSILFFSVLINFLLVFCIYSILNDQHVISLNFLKIGVVTISSNIVSVIPVTPGGIGVSEYFFNFLGEQININDIEWVTTAYIILRIMNFFANAIIYVVTYFYLKRGKFCNL